MSIEILAHCELFHGIDKRDIVSALTCLQGTIKKFKKNDFIYSMGEIVESAGIVVSGSINIVQNDIWGNQNILSHIPVGEIFAEAYACADKEPLMIDVIATKDCEILFFNINKIVNTCSNSCNFHNILTKNLLKILANKNLNLTRKIAHTTPKLIRERIMNYFSYEATKQGKYSFEIPFSRQQLADYLRVDRSALSNELSKMQKEGIISYDKNFFNILIKE